MLAVTEGRPREKWERNYRADPDALRDFRDRAHLTLEELEALSGVSYTTISRIENGKIVSPRWSTLKQLARALNVKVEDLVIHRQGSLREASTESSIPDEPGQTEENRRKIDEAKREKEERDAREAKRDASDRAP